MLNIMKETIIQQCLNILKKDEIKKEMKLLIEPFANIFFEFMMPYIYVIIFFIFLIFIMILSILLILVKYLCAINNISNNY
jgi:predicted transglutaminase-like protease